MSEPCATCAAYRRGERENTTLCGITVHTCERVARGVDTLDNAYIIDASGDLCPCGCADREPGQIAADKLVHGNAFLGPRGERIDPTTITPV